MTEPHTRTIIPALGLQVKNEDGWSYIEHKLHNFRGWFSWKEASFYLEYDRGLGNTPRVTYEKIVFEKYSFVEDLRGGFPPNISIDEDQIISREEINEEYYRNL